MTLKPEHPLAASNQPTYYGLPMLNFKAPRTQVDGKGDDYSADTGLLCEDESLARAEFKADADVNTILKKFGVNAFTAPTPGANAEIDYTIDLQTALGAIAQARAGHATLPENLRRKYPTWTELLTAIETGQYSTPEQDDARAADQRKKDMAARDQEIADYLARQKASSSEDTTKTDS